MGTCEYCKWWIGEGEEWRECEYVLSGEDGDMPLAVITLSELPDNLLKISLDTNKDFGCNQWEQVEVPRNEAVVPQEEE